MPDWANRDEARGLENLEVLGDGLLRDVEVHGDLIDRARLILDQAEDRSAPRVRARRWRLEPLTASVFIKAPPERVYEYFTGPEAIVRWMGEYAVLEPTPAGHGWTHYLAHLQPAAGGEGPGPDPGM